MTNKKVYIIVNPEWNQVMSVWETLADAKNECEVLAKVSDYKIHNFGYNWFKILEAYVNVSLTPQEVK